MRIILQALQALTIIDAKKAYRLGWRSMLYLLEARAMRLRHKSDPDSPLERARLAFTTSLNMGIDTTAYSGVLILCGYPAPPTQE